jgi:hypothetical protein
MGGYIPRPIEIDVIRKWLQGKSRDQIAKEVGIGAGTVSKIINECRQNDSKFDLMREVAVKLENQGDTIESFAPLVRLREILRGSLLSDTTTTTTITGGGQIGEGNKNHQKQHESTVEERIESLIVALQVFCFKQNLPIEDFVDVNHQLCYTANSLGVPLERLPSYVDELAEQIREKRLEKQEALKDYDVTLELLDEFSANRQSKIKRTT